MYLLAVLQPLLITMQRCRRLTLCSSLVRLRDINKRSRKQTSRLPRLILVLVQQSQRLPSFPSCVWKSNVQRFQSGRCTTSRLAKSKAVKPQSARKRIVHESLANLPKTFGYLLSNLCAELSGPETVVVA